MPIQLSTGVPAGTRVITRREGNPIKFFAFITGNSEFP